MLYTCMIGRLTKDASEGTKEVTLSNGEKATVCNFTIAVQDKYDYEKVSIYDCEVWRKTAEYLSRHGKKGKKICVEADKIILNSWQDKTTGETRSTIGLHVTNIELLEFESKANEDTARRVPASLSEMI